MKRRNTFFMKALIAVAGFALANCSENEPGISVPLYKIDPVSAYTRDSLTTQLSYNSEGRVAQYELYSKEEFISKSSVRYTPDFATCTLGDTYYQIKWAATIGALRIAAVDAFIDGALYYNVEYSYDESGRLKLVILSRSGEAEPIYISYRYEGSLVKINESGKFYELELSSEENTGNVCNVLRYCEAPLTSEYILNPDLYFLNIYGTPMQYLPKGQTVVRDDNGKLLQVGEYHYKYE